jgi:hypothetical protein
MGTTLDVDDMVRQAGSVLNQHGHENELQVWFVAEHVVDTPAVRAD